MSRLEQLKQMEQYFILGFLPEIEFYNATQKWTFQFLNREIVQLKILYNK